MLAWKLMHLDSNNVPHSGIDNLPWTLGVQQSIPPSRPIGLCFRGFHFFPSIPPNNHTISQNLWNRGWFSSGHNPNHLNVLALVSVSETLHIHLSEVKDVARHMTILAIWKLSFSPLLYDPLPFVEAIRARIGSKPDLAVPEYADSILPSR